MPTRILGCDWISIHALREEGDMLCRSANSATLNFYPRPPRGGRRVQLVENIVDSEFLSTPSARRATVPSEFAQTQERDFYPRPPRGGRPSTLWSSSCSRYFYPRPPRGGRLVRKVRAKSIDNIFLSTPSARRATPTAPSSITVPSISIHALREEGDMMMFFSCGVETEFLSTPSARRATPSRT